jgi:hypothetical protein
MRAHSRIRRSVLAAAIAAAAALPAVAHATQVEVTELNGSFASGAGGWTSSSACAPLCTVTSTVDPGVGAVTPGSASVVYSALAGLLGGLASGTSTWTSPAFTWTAATPDSAVVTFARKAAIGGLLAAGGTTTVRVQLRDQTTSTTTTVATDSLSAADAAFATRTVAIDPALLRQGHSFRLLLTTSLAAAALLSNIRISYDDIGVSASVAASDESADGDAEPAGDASQGPGNASQAGAGTAAPGAAALRLSAPASVRYAPGRRMALRVRATRAGRPVAGVTVTLRAGSTAFRIVTGRDGYAALGLLRRARSALRVTFRAGSATATTWARAR